MNKILLVGGVDNSGGAGILYDKESLGNYGLSGAVVAVTAITVQSDNRFS